MAMFCTFFWCMSLATTAMRNDPDDWSLASSVGLTLILLQVIPFSTTVDGSDSRCSRSACTASEIAKTWCSFFVCRRFMPVSWTVITIFAPGVLNVKPGALLEWR